MRLRAMSVIRLAITRGFELLEGSVEEADLRVGFAE